MAAEPAPPGPGRGRWRSGWWSGSVRVPSPNFGPRPVGTRVSLVVLHSISLPPGVYGGDAIERLFTNTLDCGAHPYFHALRGLAVSAHFLVRRDGRLVQFVATDARAWHAGASCWRGRDGCNDWSVGIELEGLEGQMFEDVQYGVVAGLLAVLRRRHPIDEVVGHEHVAPGRKADPGPGFDWPRLAAALPANGPRVPPEVLAAHAARRAARCIGEGPGAEPV